MERHLTISALMLVVACQHDDDASMYVVHESSSLAPTEPTTGDGWTSTSVETASTDATDPPIDVSRFMGIFHNEFAFIPLGKEVPNPGDPTLVNLEIHPDGTAHMTMETCNELLGPLEISLRWEALPGPMLEFFPGPGEESLRFMALSDLESVVAKIGEGCDILFEVDGQPLWMEPFRPGRACWINRCMPAWTVHIDYCDGEAPPPCE